MACYNIVTQSGKSTVVAEYIPEKRNAEAYQSEADLFAWIFDFSIRAIFFVSPSSRLKEIRLSPSCNFLVFSTIPSLALAICTETAR